MARIEFPVAMIVSAALHVLVVAGWMVMPEGEPGYALTAYRVRIVRAPARPKARQLARARETQSALEIEVPAPREATSAELAFPELDVPLTEGPIPEADRPEPPSRTPAGIAAEAPADPRRAAPSLPQREAPEAAYAEAAPSPPAPQAPEGTVAPPAAPDASPRLELPRPLTPQRTEPPPGRRRSWTRPWPRCRPCPRHAPRRRPSRARPALWSGRGAKCASWSKVSRRRFPLSGSRTCCSRTPSPSWCGAGIATAFRAE